MFAIVNASNVLHIRHLFESENDAKWFSNQYIGHGVTVVPVTKAHEHNVSDLPRLTIHNYLPWTSQDPRKDGALVRFIDGDKVVSMKVGRWLKKYFSYRFTDKEIAYLAEWEAKGSPSIPEGYTLHFATTPDEIEHVYAKGPRSCMHGSPSVRTYGAGDLAIAYVTNPDNKIVCRALTWPERKVVGRIYHDDYPLDWEGLLPQMLQDYRSIYTDHTLFCGARLLETDEGLPYFDHFRATYDENRQLIAAY